MVILTEWSPIRFQNRRLFDMFITSMIIETELDDTKSYFQLNIKITISENRRIAKLWKKGKIGFDWSKLEF